MNRWLYLVIALTAFSIACGDDGGDGDGDGGDEARVQAILALDGDAAAAQDNYDSVCGPACHGADGSGTPAGDDLTAINLSDEVIVETILYGKGTMPPYATFSNQEIADLTALVQNF